VIVRGHPEAGALLLAALVATAASPAQAPEVLRFPRLNATFRDLAPDVTPVSTGGLTIHLSSPANSLTVRGHSLELTPLGGERHRFRGWVDFLGKADLVAVFASGGPGRMEDQVLFPTQQLEIQGEVDVVAGPAGYDITTRRLPEFVDVAMQSRLGNQLLSLCEVMTILSGGDCSGLGAAFGRLRLSLPPPGETYLLQADQLTSEERALVDDYLRRATAVSK
jgi:hypothetical protein